MKLIYNPIEKKIKKIKKNKNYNFQNNLILKDEIGKKD
jgi:hypothetical protein